MIKWITRIALLFVVVFVFFAVIHPANDDLYQKGFFSFHGIKDTGIAIGRVLVGDNTLTNFATGYAVKGAEKAKCEFWCTDFCDEDQLVRRSCTKGECNEKERVLCKNGCKNGKCI